MGVREPGRGVLVIALDLGPAVRVEVTEDRLRVDALGDEAVIASGVVGDGIPAVQ